MMPTEFRLFPEQASTVAGRVDALYLFLVALTAVIAIAIAGLILFFAIRYRRSRRPLHPEQYREWWTLEIIWSAIPFVIAMGIFFWGATLYHEMATPPADAMQIYAIGKQWMWKIEHPAGREEINHLHVPLGRPVKLTMTSEDVIHSMFVPDFRVKQDVLPGRYTTLWFEATKPGEYHLFCAEYCGAKHSQMIGTVHVMQPAEFQEWLAGESRAEPLVVRGERLFQKLRCDSCHHRQSGHRGPDLAGRFGKPVAIEGGGTAVLDANYIRESLLEPKAKIAASYQPLMPSYEKQLTEAEIVQLVEYIRSLTVGTENLNP